ncbi:M48 family metalloprotease [Litchfieldella rifensis]|uniref:M48 family metalloprotease n=1 Tax=Litchfieldella rifensis TaxID=762643 RepID=A0ABV7LKJ8_9GAMM
MLGAWLLLMAFPAAAQLRLYDDDLLNHWAAITPADIRALYAEDIRPALSAEERRRLDDVELAFPLRCPLIASEPFCYYLVTSSEGQRRVVMSVASLRAFGDLALAMAWLQLTDHAIDTPSQYLAMLRHRRAEEFPGGRYPAPLAVLGIPEDVREQPEVMALYGKIYTSSLVFVLLHELGHALHRHPGYGPEVSREQTRHNEAEADAFALEVMARLAYPPLGMSVFFTLMAHWEPNRWHFTDEASHRAYLEAATHPLTAERLRQLAAALAERDDDFARAEPDFAAARARVAAVATEIDRLAGFMDDRDIQEGIVRTGRATGEAMLKPRKVGELAIEHSVSAAGRPFEGEFEGVLRDSSGELPVLLALERHGDLVQGFFTYGLGLGQLRGEVRDGRLHYGWTLGADQGQGVFEASPDGQRLDGTWGLERSSDDGGTWEAWRSD